jgi:7-carboxy-7-deazaguanine synthase
MLKLRVNEIFYSLQGEGARAGAPSIFIRLQGCNLSCDFCDTDFSTGNELSLSKIFTKIKKFPAKQIIWTGGEPALQLNAEVVNYFKKKGYFQAIETNGTIQPPENLDWITLSPKVPEKILQKNFPNGVNEIKFVWSIKNKSIPKTKIITDYYFLQPESEGNKINTRNLAHCISLCLKNPGWRISPQLHKIWKIK